MPGHGRTEEVRPHGRGDAPHGAGKEPNIAEENDPVEPQGGGGEPVTDWKAEARKWERRSKENADKAKAYDELQEQSKTELVADDDEESMRAFAEAVAKWGKPPAGPMDLLVLRAIRSCRAIESR